MVWRYNGACQSSQGAKKKKMAILALEYTRKIFKYNIFKDQELLPKGKIPVKFKTIAAIMW